MLGCWLLGFWGSEAGGIWTTKARSDARRLRRKHEEREEGGRAGGAVGYVFERLSYVVWGACIEVQRQLGPHCMEVDYQRALELALRKRGLAYLREAEIPIAFDGVEVTRRRVDFVIWDDTRLTPPDYSAKPGKCVA